MARHKPGAAGAPPPPAGPDAGTGAAPRCGGCRFWWATPGPDEAEGGECRRYPPGAGVRAALAAGPLMRFPLTLAGDWCGEFQAT